MKDPNTISYGEIEKQKGSITSVIFPAKSFNLESILRWLMDKKFSTNNFFEANGNYIFTQPARDNYTTLQTKRLESEDIWIEVGNQ